MHTFTHWGPGSGFWPVIPAIWGLFWVGVVALVIRARRRGGWGPRHAEARATASAEQIIAERYARGEMSDDEYFEHMSVLRGGAT
jgi:putative membrane protein